MSSDDAELSLFRQIRSSAEFASFFGTSQARLRFLLYGSGYRYRTFELRKASGGLRTIEAPPAPIRAMQGRLLACLSKMFCPIREVYGFVLGRGVVQNARVHLNQSLVLNIDLRDFFPSINFGRVRGLFRRAPFKFPDNIATIMAQLCCYRGHLPQGAPTSPIISNLICRGLDKQMRALTRTFTCRYSRYADDITISTGQPSLPAALVKNAFSVPPVLGDDLTAIVSTNGFAINEAKTRVQTRRQRQSVTGITVNKRLNVRRSFVREIRAALNCWRSKGEAQANQIFQARYDRRQRGGGIPPLSEHLKGCLDFLSMVRGDTDPLFYRYALEHAELAQSGRVRIHGTQCLSPHLLAHALWILTGENAGGEEVVTATAFTLDDLGVVTAAHTLEHPGVTSWFLRPATAIGNRFRLVKAVVSRHHDLALIEPPCFRPGRLVRGDSRIVKTTDDINLVGFPKWSGPTYPVRLEKGHVTERKIASLVSHIMVSATIATGNSGGPLLTSAGVVVGVARYSDAADIAPNGAVASEHLDELRGANSKSVNL